MERILVCGGTGCVSCGCRAIATEMQQQLAAAQLAYQVVLVGCHGFCEQGPLVIIEQGDVFYGKVTVADVGEIIREHLQGGRLVEHLLYHDPATGAPIVRWQDIPFYKLQTKRVLMNCGLIDQDSLTEYLQHDGYSALHKVVTEMQPQQVVDEVKASGLRGRGGAGFTTGMKWQFALNATGEEKYVVCNADEGDPGAFMDRSILEGDPHAVIEGMVIAAYAIGAHYGYIYVRAEYPSATKRLRSAIVQAHNEGYLGEKIMDTDFSFDLEIKEGAGAFVCGEETALLMSIEGNRGMPKIRPPFPAESGLWGNPSNINNVETYANVPLILREGAAAYAAIGTENSKGTKVFALTGKICNTGLAEVPMGTTLRKIIFEIGGGIQDGKAFKAVQIGGPSGGCLPAELLDLPMDYDSLTNVGAMIGSGGLVTMDETTCMVDVARFFLNFTQSESCGKCTPCREGSRRMLEILTRITEGQGEMADLDRLEELGRIMSATSLCGLGQTAANPVLTTLRYFRHEYEAHILDKRCPAAACAALLCYEILPDKCTGCTVCMRVCPAGAISGAHKEPHVIDLAKCIKCDACRQKCKFAAIVKR